VAKNTGTFDHLGLAGLVVYDTAAGSKDSGTLDLLGLLGLNVYAAGAGAPTTETSDAALQTIGSATETSDAALRISGSASQIVDTALRLSASAASFEDMALHLVGGDYVAWSDCPLRVVAPGSTVRGPLSARLASSRHHALVATLPITAAVHPSRYTAERS